MSARDAYFVKIFMRIACWLLAVAGESDALAQERFILGAAMAYRNEKSKADSAEGEVTTTVYNVSAGADIGDGIFVGLKYFRHETAYGSDDSDADLTITGLGGSLGYFHKSGFMLSGSYLFDVEKELPNGDPKVVYKDGTGSVLDVGYLFDMKSWAIGPQLTIATTEYEKVEISGQDPVDLDGTWLDESTYPYLAFFMYF